jgi:hypothetical protein
VRTESKILDPRDPNTISGGAELLDASVVRRGDRWWMYLAGQAAGYGPTEIYSASLDSGAPLSATGLTLSRDAGGQLIALADHRASGPWDSNGGRHCPAYVKGWNPHKQAWVERIYYAGAAQDLWGPYTIGFLEWDGKTWVDQPEPVFIANEDWERGSVYEPNLIYHDGTWKMWYVAGSNQADYLVQGYAESEDGCTGWTKHEIFAPSDMRMFDFCVRQRLGAFDAVFARVWVSEGTPPSETGLWWCCAETPSGRLSDWGEPVQIMTAEDRGWHSGPWKPSLAFDDPNGKRAFVFFDGLYRTSDPGPFPFAFTLGCLEMSPPGQDS